jgi:hypothetical protein
MSEAHNVAQRLRCPLGGVRNIGADFIVAQAERIESLESDLNVTTQLLADCNKQLNTTRLALQNVLADLRVSV